MASIEKRSSTSYRIKVSCGYNSQGKQINKTKTIKLDAALTERQKEKELQKLAYEFENQVLTGQFLDGSRMTFQEFTQKWLDTYAKIELSPKTLFRYNEMLESRIIPALGHIKLEKLQPTHLLEFYNNLKESGIRLDAKYIANKELLKYITSSNFTYSYLSTDWKVSDKTVSRVLNLEKISSKSAKLIAEALNKPVEKMFTTIGEEKPLASRTILHHHRLISTILQAAVQWQLLLNNPAARVKAPKVDNTPVKHYDENQTKQLLKALDSEELKYKTMVLLDIFTGLRLGELMGLEWNDINFSESSIVINKASQYVSGKGTFEKSPKNETSKRRISIPTPVVLLLKEYRTSWLEQKLKCGDLWQGSERLFITWDGRPLFTYTLTNWFPKFLERHNLPKITPHGLRHTSATLLASQGLDFAAISKRLGHARTSTTMDIYIHALKSSDEHASNLLEKALLDDKKQAK